MTTKEKCIYRCIVYDPAKVKALLALIPVYESFKDYDHNDAVKLGKTICYNIGAAMQKTHLHLTNDESFNVCCEILKYLKENKSL